MRKGLMDQHSKKWRMLVSLSMIFGLFFMTGCDESVRLAVLDSMNSLAVGLVDAVFLGISQTEGAEGSATSVLPKLMDSARMFC
jgi:hypothetical protein